MTDEPNLLMLFEDFPELCSDGIMLEKELLAHFGLLFSAYALLEAALQNCYVFWNLGQILAKGQIKNQEEWQLHYDSLEKRPMLPLLEAYCGC